MIVDDCNCIFEHNVLIIYDQAWLCEKPKIIVKKIQYFISFHFLKYSKAVVKKCLESIFYGKSIPFQISIVFIFYLLPLLQMHKTFTVRCFH